MRILYRSDAPRAAAWARYFAEHAPDIDFRVWPDAGKLDEIEYLIALRESPPPPPPAGPSLDDGLLDEAGSFLDSVTGALGALDSLGLPDFGDPTPPLKGTVDGVKGALGGLGDVTGPLGDLFGSGG